MMIVVGLAGFVTGAVLWRYRDAAAQLNLDMKRAIYPEVTEHESVATVVVVAIGLMAGGAACLVIGLLVSVLGAPVR